MLFLGCLFDREDEELILNLSKGGLQNAVNTFEWNLIDGINSCKSKPIDIINVLPVGTYPKHFQKLILPTRKWSYNGSDNTEVGCINLPFIKQIIRTNKIKNIIKEYNDKNIIMYSTYLPFLKAVKSLDSSYNVTLIVTDLPEFYDLASTNPVKKMLRAIYNKMVYKYLERIDSYVLLTEYMKDPLCVGEKPYVVVEGITNSTYDIPDINKKNDKKVILYTGTLHYRFGIKYLLDAFSEISDKDYELWICGSGETENEIRLLCEKDDRIRFFGYKSKSEVLSMQQQATILINPRQDKGEYTKYSFPSKTIEYMQSGTPVLMYKLSGIPDKYDDYLYYIDPDLDVLGLKNRIVELCEIPQDELMLFGLKAKEFVEKNMSGQTQAKKILEMISGEYDF